MKKLIAAVVALTVLLPSTAIAGEPVALPLPGGNISVRYVRGTPTMQIDDDLTTVNVTPVGNDHNKLQFAVTAFNKAQEPMNFGIENVTATLGGQQLAVLDKDRLVKIAKNRETWKMVAIAAAGGLMAASASMSAGESHYRSRLVTPSGRVYRYSGTYVNNTEKALAVGAASASTAYAVSEIQTGLDQITANLNNDVLQTTTVDPGTGYGGLVVLDKLKAKDAYNQLLVLTVHLNGRDYAFPFNPSKE